MANGKIRIQILGSGTSMGVPMVGCKCQVCGSANPKDKRLRTSALLKIGDIQILIDTSADYRQQMLNVGINYLDAVLYTHHHVDHILGMDDLRSFNLLNKSSIPVYGLEETIRNLKRFFGYAFNDSQQSKMWRLPINIIKETPFLIGEIEIIPIPLLHGRMPVLGFRIGDFAYCTDVSKIPLSSYDRLKNLKVLVLDALRFKPHPTHFSVDEAIQEAQKIDAKATYFTHISHAIMHDELETQLPPGIHLAYDGLTFDI